MSASPQVTEQTGRIEATFARCRQAKRAALVLYLTSGFPDEATTRRLLPVLERAGCDLVELGVPFSDPIADGPTIQRASTCALEAGMTLDKTMALLADFRKSSQLPVVLFGAYNPFLARGIERVTAMARAAGADGILAADLPVEESEELRLACKAQGMHAILLAAPTSPSQRLRAIGDKSSGFLYCISVKGITGARQSVASDVAAYLGRIRQATDVPLAVGFGISTPEHVAAVAPHCDAVVVGSALISLIEKCTNEGGDLERTVEDYVRSLASELGAGRA